MTIGSCLFVAFLILIVCTLIAIPIALLLLWLMSDDKDEFKDLIRFNKGDK